jgi:hypothetical protein
VLTTNVYGCWLPQKESRSYRKEALALLLTLIEATVELDEGKSARGTAREK